MAILLFNIKKYKSLIRINNKKLNYNQVKVKKHNY